MNDTLKQIGSMGIVPVVVLNKVSDAEPLAESLIKGGLACAEVTFRTDAAEESIRAIAKKFPQMLVGAGTVLTTEQVDRAIGAGAKFIVSPGLNPKVVEYCKRSSSGVHAMVMPLLWSSFWRASFPTYSSNGTTKASLSTNVVSFLGMLLEVPSSFTFSSSLTKVNSL